MLGALIRRTILVGVTKEVSNVDLLDEHERRDRQRRRHEDAQPAGERAHDELSYDPERRRQRDRLLLDERRQHVALDRLNADIQQPDIERLAWSVDESEQNSRHRSQYGPEVRDERQDGGEKSERETERDTEKDEPEPSREAHDEHREELSCHPHAEGVCGFAQDFTSAVPHAKWHESDEPSPIQLGFERNEQSDEQKHEEPAERAERAGQNSPGSAQRLSPAEKIAEVTTTFHERASPLVSIEDGGAAVASFWQRPPQLIDLHGDRGRRAPDRECHDAREPEADRRDACAPWQSEACRYPASSTVQAQAEQHAREDQQQHLEEAADEPDKDSDHGDDGERREGSPSHPKADRGALASRHWTRPCMPCASTGSASFTNPDVQWDPPMPLWLELLIIVALAIANGLFAAAEIAVISVRKSRLRELVVAGNEAAARVERLRRDPERFLATVQIGITVIGATAAAFGGAALAVRLSALFRRVGLGEHADDIALTSVILFVSYVSLVLGELVPKSLALRAAERYSMFVARPLLVLGKIARPVVWFLTASSNVVLRLFGDRTTFAEARLSREELKQLVEDAANEGAVEPNAGEIASRALDLGRLRVGAVMLPRTAITPIDVGLGAEDVRRVAARASEDRIPVYEGSWEHVIGYVTLRDMLVSISDRPLRELVRAPYFVPENVLAVDVLREMQRRRIHIGFVVDELGSVAGIVTLEELVEELVGDIFAEHQSPHPSIRREADGTAIVRADTAVHEVNRTLGLDLPEGNAWTTLGGLMLVKHGSIPSNGARVRVGSVDIEVLEATRRRLLAVRVRPPRAVGGAPTQSADQRGQ